MADPQRLEELRRRVEKDPASLAFAQLAEECRRAGEFQEAVRVCREGLAHHPDYLSARVTLGRALIGLEHLDQAAAELAGVLRIAPENLAALRGLAEVFQRRGMRAEALDYYRTAHALAPHDPDVSAAIDALEHQPAPPVAPAEAAEPVRHELRVAAQVPVSAAPEPAPAERRETPGGSAAPPSPPTQPDHVPLPSSAALRVLERWLAVIESRRAAEQHGAGR